ncbi:MAG: DegV family protein [Anaerolineales bacterium]|uniref:DegV family protein n=1 Tax=Candidatus Villigracilis vicinus TaxID=3140679 RepID=UPI0031358B95|nr:DegV family protein [Anaerolineales bacterium]MBK7449685.1 DegV family protein [Anaerolineales bacterium]MBK9782065.1 DegV family protein [Anaerolineales bacterium]
MKLGIVTDSTADLPSYLIEQHEIHVVPTVLILEGKEYKDGVGITREDFYNQLPALQTPATTAAPSIGDFLTPYQSLFDSGCDHILSIHVSGKLSGVVNVARRAAQDFPGKVTCVDSGSLSMGIGFQVLAAAEAAELGVEAALQAVEDTRNRTKVIAALDTMEYLRRSGRVPAVVARIGGLLSIKPVVELRDGEVKPMSIVRTTSQADELTLAQLLEVGEMQRLAILHTNAEPRARQLLNEMMKEKSRMFVPRDVLFVNVTAVIGTHLGPHCIGFAAVRK